MAKRKRVKIGPANWDIAFDAAINIKPPAYGGDYVIAKRSGEEFYSAEPASTKARRKLTHKQEWGLLQMEAHGKRTARKI